MPAVTASATVTWDVPANVTVTADAPFGVPEPTSMALTVPFAVMAWMRRRRSV